MPLVQTELSLAPLLVVSSLLRPFSVEEKAEACANGVGPAAVDAICQDLLHSEAPRLFSSSVVGGESERSSRDHEVVGVTLEPIEIAQAFDGLIDRALSSGKLDKLEPLPWYAINLQMTVDKSPGVSNASKVLDGLGKKGLAFTVGQQGVLSVFKAFELMVDLLGAEPAPAWLVLTSADRWWGCYFSAENDSVDLGDSAAIGVYRVGRSNTSNMIILTDGSVCREVCLSDGFDWAEWPLFSALLAWLGRPVVAGLPVMCMVSPRCADVVELLMDNLKKSAGLAVLTIASSSVHTGSSYWQMGVERVIQVNQQGESSPCVLLHVEVSAQGGVGLSAMWWSGAVA